MGSVSPYTTKEGKRYRVRYRQPDGTQSDKRGFRTKRDAEVYLARVETLKSNGEFIAPSAGRVRVAEWSEVWLHTMVNLKTTTRSGYQYSLSRHVLPRWGKVALGDVSHSAIQAWVNELSQTLSPSTVRQIYLVLSAMLKFAVRDRKIARNPSDDINLPKLRKANRGYLTHRQVRRLADEVGEYDDVIVVLAYSGMRWGEMAALAVRHIDLVSRTIVVERSVSEVGGQLVWGTTKTDERRRLGFPEFVTPVLRSRCAGKSADDLVFTTVIGTPLRNNNFRRRVFNPALARIQESDPSYPTVTPHDLRHTAASLAISAGANVKAVQRMLGHSSAAMTLDVYADLFDDDLQSVAVALDQAGSSSFVGKSWANRLNAADSTDKQKTDSP